VSRRFCNQVRQTAERLETERAQGQDIFEDGSEDQDALPKSTVARVVGLDGVYVHAKDQRSRTEGWFEVIAGKSLATEDQASKSFDFVSRYDPQPQGRLFEWLKTQRMQRDQPITFLSDGDTVRELPIGLHPKS
jgi:hypothetical protein